VRGGVGACEHWDSVSDEFEPADALLVAGFQDRVHRFDEAASGGTLSFVSAALAGITSGRVACSKALLVGSVISVDGEACSALGAFTALIPTPTGYRTVNGSAIEM
jgi:hypothetical protein